MNPGQPDLSRIRHDLRTPVNQIVGYCELLLEDETLPAAFNPDLQRILAGGRQLLTVLAEYFDEAHFEERRRDQFRLHHDLRTPVNHIIGYSELLEELASDRPDTPADLAGDLARIRRAAQDWLALMEEHLVVRGEPGTEAPPAFVPPGIVLQAAVPRSAEPASLKGEGRVLVVDDDAANREILGRRLRRHGYTVVTEGDGLSGLRRLRAERFDLVLLDLVMPGLDGYQVLAHMKSEPALRHLPVLMISGLDQENGIARCIEAGADDYLTKPFNPVLLRARISACLEKKRLRDRDEANHRALQESQRLLLAELAEAGAYVQSILPPPIDTGTLHTDWCFQPSAQLGGDAFGYHALPDGRFVVYLIDVSGHGVGAALLSASAINVLRTGRIWEECCGKPACALGTLNRAFPMERHHQQFFTAWIGIVDPATATLDYASAGHPPALLFGPEALPISLRTGNPPVGAMPDTEFRGASIALPPDADLFVFSDGVYELPLGADKTGTLPAFTAALTHLRNTHGFRVEQLLHWARSQARDGNLDDDYSLLRVSLGGVGGRDRT